MDAPVVSTDFTIWRERWHRMHLEELVVHPALRGYGIGQWFLFKWLMRIKPLSGAINTTAAHRDEFAKDLGVDAAPEIYFREGGTVMDPVITLCVDAWNIGARKLYAKLGFQEYVRKGADGAILECPFRISMVGPMLTIERALRAITNNGSTPPILEEFANDTGAPVRERHLKTPDDALEFMQSTSDGPKGILYFDVGGEAMRNGSYLAQMVEMEFDNYAGPHAMPEMLSSEVQAHPERHYEDEGVRKLLVDAYLYDGAELQPRAPNRQDGEPRKEEDVTDDHVRSFFLDRLLSRDPPRVMMTAAEWESAFNDARNTTPPTHDQGLWRPRLTDDMHDPQAAFDDKRFLFLVA